MSDGDEANNYMSDADEYVYEDDADEYTYDDDDDANQFSDAEHQMDTTCFSNDESKNNEKIPWSW